MKMKIEEISKEQLKSDLEWGMEVIDKINELIEAVNVLNSSKEEGKK